MRRRLYVCGAFIANKCFSLSVLIRIAQIPKPFVVMEHIR